MKDNVIVLYRPSDLTALTNKSGAVASHTFESLHNADAAYQYSPPHYPLRGKGIVVPALDDVLKRWPEVFFFLDVKYPNASPQQFAETLFATLQKDHALHRVRIYSTDEKYLNALPKALPRFESRELTRTVLANITMNHTCSLTPQQNRERWYGFEFNKQVKVIEKFTLGEGVTTSYLKWDKEAFNCFNAGGKDKIILFGINTIAEYQQAEALGAEGVLVDSPEYFQKIRHIETKSSMTTQSHSLLY